MRYINSIPRKLPEGRVLVHNRARPARPLGTGGFRAWTQILDDTIEPCRCNFAGYPTRSCTSTIGLNGMSEWPYSNSAMPAATSWICY
jgi:hypothetical protein